MNLKKEVVARIKEKLIREQSNLKHKCESNKWNINKLVDEQKIMKREIAQLGSMIRDLD